MGLEKIIDFILQFLTDFLPFYVCKAWQKGVVLRFGKVHRIQDPGIHFKIPFVDDIINQIVVTTTIETPVQSLVTKDGQEVTTKSVIKYSISDCILYTTEIYDATDAISDFTQGHIMDQVNNHDYAECRDTGALSNVISKKVRAEVRKYGIHIEQITVTNFIKTHNFRLFNDTET